jgi:mycothiol synthase
MKTAEKLKIAELYPQFVWRPARLADAEALQALLVARDEAEGLSSASTVEEMQKQFKDTWLFDIEQQTLIGLAPDGTVAAFGFVFANPAPVDKRFAFIWVEAHPAYQQVELRKALVVWGLDRTMYALDQVDSVLPRVIGVSVQDNRPAWIEVYQALGFEEARYFYHMRRDLSRPVPSPQLDKGLRLVKYQPELDEALMLAFNESFLDHWNFEPVSEADWHMWFTGSESFRPDLSYLVLDGDQIAGFSINAVHAEQNQLRGVNEGWIHQLGTRRPWRHRGIATALLLASMQAFQLESLDYATLGVDTENPTGAMRIYERVGFVPVKRIIAFQMLLDKDGPGALDASGTSQNEHTL